MKLNNQTQPTKNETTTPKPNGRTPPAKNDAAKDNGQNQQLTENIPPRNFPP